MIKLFNCAVILIFIITGVNAQNYCVQFSKKDKKTVLIKEGRNISFVFVQTAKWRKGRINKITSDSLYLEEYISKDDILMERENNFIVTGCELTNFRMMAYNNTAKAVGKGSAVVIIFSLAVLSGGADIFASFSNDEKSRIQKKFFKKNVDFDEGWNAEIVLCE